MTNIIEKNIKDELIKLCNKHTEVRLGTQVKKKRRKHKQPKNQDLESVKQF